MFFENDHDTDARLNLEFEEVEAYKCTYYSATETSMLEAYDRLVDLGSSEWLQVIAANVHARGGAAAGLSHLMIMFDDGPCYEIVCRSYRVIHDASHTT
jgi:hypothetical protein